MNFFKRAILSITRRGGKTAILLALVFVLGNVIAGAISIEQSVENTGGSVLRGIVPVATLDVNHDKMNELINEMLPQPQWDWSEEAQEETQELMNEYYEQREELWQELMKDAPQLTAETAEELAALPGVDFFDYTSYGGFESTTLRKYYPPEMSEQTGMYASRIPGEGESDYFSIKGSQHSENLDLKLNAIEIVEGRPLNEQEMESGEYAVLVSKSFAEINNLSLGSTFTFESEIRVYDYSDESQFMMRGVEVAEGESMGMDIGFEEYTPPEPIYENTLEFDFTIVGIYEPTMSDAVDPSLEDWELSTALYRVVERHSTIYTSNKASKDIVDRQLKERSDNDPAFAEAMERDYYSNQVMPFYVFKDMDALDTWADAVVEQYEDSFYITDNDTGIGSVIAPLENISKLANIILYVGIGASLVILSLLVTLFLRDRRNEIGIYLALGERKGRVVAQVLAEVLLVSMVAITLSLFTGNVISGQLSNAMIENEVNASQQEEVSTRPTRPSYNYDYNPLVNLGYGADVTLEELADQYEVTLGSDIVVFFFAVGILTVLFSTLLPIIYILRLNPRKILM